MLTRQGLEKGVNQGRAMIGQSSGLTTPKHPSRRAGRVGLLYWIYGCSSKDHHCELKCLLGITR